MFAKIMKVGIFTVTLVLFLSMIIPAGGGTDSGYAKNLRMPYGFGNGEGLKESYYHPVLTVEEPKMLFVVEDEDGGKIIINVPKDTVKEEIEKIIVEKLEGEQLDEKIPEIEEKEEEIEVPKEIPPEEPEEDPEPEVSEKNVKFVNYLFEGYFDGYLFCDIKESLNFDASLLYQYNQIIKYEWDFDGDGTYEQVNFSSIISHKYKDIGLYDMKIKITYSYNYTYYPLCGNDIIWYDSPILDIDDGGTNSGVSIDIEYMYPQEWNTIEKSIEYEIKVSVGSKEVGYPPILDFNVVSEKEDEETIEDPIDVIDKDDDLDYIITPTIDKRLITLPVEPIRIINPITFPGIIEPESNASLKNPTIYVKAKQIPSYDTLPDQDGPTVEFDASKTIDKNEGTIFTWDFGDGESGEGTSVNHTYKNRGSYTVVMSAEEWDHSISKTFTVLRGSEDPPLVSIGNHYGKPDENYLFCDVNDPMVFDIYTLTQYIDLDWVEWDFDGDGIYEENATTAWITKTFSAPGYFEVNFKYTYSYESYPYVICYADYDTSNQEKNQEPVTYYYSLSYRVKVVVIGENNEIPLIPDYTIEAPARFSWWNQQNILEDFYNATEQKDITYLKYYSKWNSRLNSWKNPVTFHANTTIFPENTDFDDYTFTWDFGDGTTGTGKKVTHTFKQTNLDYEVRLTVSKDNFKTSIMKTIAPRPYSPNIYLYRENSDYDTIRVIVDGRVTKAVPLVELGSEIVWEDVYIENGKLLYNGKSYDFLYYEELLNEPRTSEYGWILERDEKGRLYLNDNPISLEGLKEFFGNELRRAGLYEHEIEDFVDEWLGEGARLFPGDMPFRYAIMYVPEKQVEELIQIKTELDYEEIIRVHFLVMPAEDGLQLKQPVYPEHRKGQNVLHEWGVYFGQSQQEEEKDDSLLSWYDGFVNGYNDPQIYVEYENKLSRFFQKPASKEGQSFA